MNTNYLAILVIIFSILAAQVRENSALCEEMVPLTTVRVSTRDELRAALQDAHPGTKILIAPGTYRGGLSFARLEGAKGKPIVLAALDAERPPVIKGGTACFHLTDPSYVELHNLVLTGATGNGLNVDDGGSYSSPAHHVVLRNLQIHDIGPSGNRDGIKFSGVDDFAIEGCTIERWGSSGSPTYLIHA